MEPVVTQTLVPLSLSMKSSSRGLSEGLSETTIAPSF
jgi:hypothetical protein